MALCIEKLFLPGELGISEKNKCLLIFVFIVTNGFGESLLYSPEEAKLFPLFEKLLYKVFQTVSVVTSLKVNVPYRNHQNNFTQYICWHMNSLMAWADKY